MYRGNRVHHIKKDAYKNATDARLNRIEPYRPAREEMYVYEERAVSKSVYEKENGEPNLPYRSPKSIVPNSFLGSLNLSALQWDIIFKEKRFLYLKIPETASLNSVYELKVCSYNDINLQDYFTLSERGVCRFAGKLSEFCDLSTWERNYTVFYKIQKIRFFRKFRLFKNFFKWRKLIRVGKLAYAREKLKAVCFLGNEALIGSLYKVRLKIEQLETKLLFNCSLNVPLKIEEFVEVQLETSDKFVELLCEVQEYLFDELSSICSVVMSEFLTEQNVDIKKPLTFMEKIFLARHKAWMGRYIKLVDKIVIDWLVFHGVHSFKILVKWFNTESRQGIQKYYNMSALENLVESTSLPPILKVETVFVNEESGCTFMPQINVLLDKMTKLPEKVFQKLAAFTMFSTNECFQQYVDIAPDLDLMKLIVERNDYRNALEDLISGIEEIFLLCEDFALVFSPHREKFLENLENYEKHIEDMRHVTISDLEESIKVYKAQSTEFDKVPIGAFIEIFQVDSTRIKDVLMPSPLLCLEAIQRVLPKIINADWSDLLMELDKSVEKLEYQPVLVKEFTAKCAFVDRIQESYSNFTNKLERIETLKELMVGQSWKICEENTSGITKCQAQFLYIQDMVMEFLGKKGADTQKFISKLKDNIPKVRIRLNNFREELDNEVFVLEAEPDIVLQELEPLQNELQELKEIVSSINQDESFLNLEQSEFLVLDDVDVEFKVKYSLWTTKKLFSEASTNWLQQDISSIDIDLIEKEVMTAYKIAIKAEKSIPNNVAASIFKAQVENFKQYTPLISSLTSPTLKDRHWEIINNMVGFDVKSLDGATFETLIKRGLADFSQDIQKVSVNSKQEQVLEQMLDKLDRTWMTVDFEVNNYKEQRAVYILGSLEDVLTNLDDSLVVISTILGSRYIAGVKDRVLDWKRRLLLMQETVDEWITCQRNWIYLESIFGAADIQRQLPRESKMFFTVDSFFRKLMISTFEDPIVFKICGTNEELVNRLRRSNEDLDTIQKSLEDYLETKRSVFPRFYFLSNDELLQILSQTKDVQSVQPHLRKCFDALNALDFGPDKKSIDIFAMISPENERVSLGKNLKARGNVEDWLTNVENSMRKSLKKLMKEGLLDLAKEERKAWVKKHPGQVVATIAQVFWAQQTEQAILQNTLSVWHKQNLEELHELIVLIRGNLTKRERKVIVALVTTDVHARDIVESLHDQSIADLENFVWQMQLRYYFNSLAEVVEIKHSDALIDYAHEYQGCTSRLVITPLTDRCWLTITGALNLKLGAAPAGPAGTGKTESSKDLAKALGVQCIVFNCSDQIDYKMMGKLFMGLAQTGAWTCLDEFNRIDIEVLSVVAQQLLLLRQGRLNKPEDEAEAEINFMGSKIRLLDHHVIVTMNPGYAGRTELPDNLKVCFRPVSMMVPDYALIAEIMLFAEGFGDAKTLSRKMIKLFHLSSQQLSQQPHYDYGLRAVKSVLVMAGSLKRGNPEVGEELTLIRALQDSNVPKCLKEDLPLFYAIVKDLFPSVEVPKNDYGDFEEVIIEEIRKMKLQPVKQFIVKVIQQFDIFNIRFGATIVGPTLSGKTKCYEVLKNAMLTMKKRSCGDERYQNAVIKVLNPKCISMGELYGEFNDVTQEWQDGLASTIMRQAVNVVTSEHAEIKIFKKGRIPDTNDFAPRDEQALPISVDNLFVNKFWIVFDGPIDALWIENMNTVLDDNMTLCLANGERIKLVPEMKCLFEVNDLEVASPATVSRLGVMYMSPEDLGARNIYRSVFEVYLSELPKYDQERLEEFFLPHMLGLFDNFFTGFIDFHRKCKAEIVETTNNILVMNLTKIFLSLLQPSNGSRIWIDKDKLDVTLEAVTLFKDATDLSFEVNTLSIDMCCQLLDFLFIFALVWSVGGTVESEQWEEYDQFLRDMNSNLEKPISLPAKGLIFDYFVNCFVEQGAAWEKFSSIGAAFTYHTNMNFFDIYVDNINSTRYQYICKKLMGSNFGFFLTGQSGSGKTACISNMLRELSFYEEFDISNAFRQLTNAGVRQDQVLTEPVFINFSAQTASAITQATIESKLEKKRKVLLGAPANKKVVIFIDDINMPLVEEYGAQQPIELLRFLLDRKGLYDREKLYFKEVIETILVVAGAPPGGGRHKVTPRFKRHFCILNHVSPTKETLLQIFNSIFTGFVGTFNKEDLTVCARSLTKAVVSLYENMKQEFLPTPRCFHYLFNLRDVSKVFQGMLQIKAKNCADSAVLAKLCIHESERVFADRLIDLSDRTKFSTLLTRVFKSELRDYLDLEEHYVKRDLPILFSSYCKPGLSANERFYEEQEDEKKIVSILNDFLEEYNLTNSNQMNLIFFRDALEHINSIARILAQPRGNAFLIGVGGCGKRSVVRLATFINQMEFFQIEIIRNYGINEFREDLKSVLTKTGVEGRHVVFMFTDSHIVDELFIEDINSILNSGEVANMFLPEEEDKINNDMIPICQKLGIPESQDNIRNLFLSRIRENLKIALCMSPVGESLRIRCRNFPSLINATTVVWFSEWPKEALEEVAIGYFQESKVLSSFEEMSQALMSALVDLCSFIHTSVVEYAEKFYGATKRRIYTTPKSYLDLINLYLSLVKAKKMELQTVQDKMKTGVRKLNETNSIVDDLKEELVELQPVLVEKKKETTELLQRVASEKADAQVVEQRVAADEAVVQKQKDEVAVIQADAQKDLDSALPALQKAIQALDALDKKDITEIKSFAKPPPAVQLVMDSICLFFDLSPSWDNSKKLLSDGNFMKNLQEYDKDNIPEKTLKKVKKLLKEDNMQVEVVKKVSKAATSLCLWVHAMNLYSDVAKTVEPKRQLLRKLNSELQTANDLLSVKQKELQQVRDKVANLENMLNETLASKKALEDQSKLTENRLIRAEKLTSGLADEGKRWKLTVQQTISDMTNIIGNSLLAAGCVSYYGGFSHEYRQDLVLEWVDRCKALSIPMSNTFSLQGVLSTDVEVKDWQASSLPTDDFSTDNAILTYAGERWPLLIDPQLQALKWVKTFEKKNSLVSVKATNDNCLRSLEGAIRNGQPLLIEDVGEILDPSLDPVLGREVFNQGGRTLIHLGDSDIDYDPAFKLILCTKLANPHYLPEVCIKVTIINFCVTQTGLSDQLLGIVVRNEKPEIEKRKAQVVQTVADDMKQLQDLESKVLRLLSESEGNVLDDQVLIDTLADSKEKSMVISKRLIEAEKTKEDIEESRNAYRKVAIFGSLLYFCIADLAALDPMYQFSLTFFCKLFEQCLSNTPMNLNYYNLEDYRTWTQLDQRLQDLQDYSLTEVFTTICRGLFEKHKLVYAALVCFRREILLNRLIEGEYSLLTASIAEKANDIPDIPEELGTSEEKWEAFITLSIKYKGLDGISVSFDAVLAHMIENSKLWDQWFLSKEPFSEQLPITNVTSFQKLLLVKIFRPESLWYAIAWFVEEQLGQAFVEYPTVTMQEVYKTTTFATPCIFILSSGADPTDMLLRYAKEAGYNERISIVSLGQGQGKKSEKLIETAKRTGDWVLLQNCHLAKSWMQSLEAIVVRLEVEAENDAFDADFRLFLTSMPAAYFPVTVLQNGVKLTNEPPKGIRANLVRSFETLFKPKDWESCKLREPWKRLSIGLAFFHAVIQERRKFGPLGWNIRYEFNDTDLETSLAVLRRFLDSANIGKKSAKDVIPWDALRYVTGEINYGGRVTDDWDRRCLMTILDIYSTKKLLDKEYYFSKDDHYYVMNDARYDEKRQFLKQLPAIDNPVIFGMHNNAEIVFQVSESVTIVRNLVNMQQDSMDSGNAHSLDEVVQNICTELIEDMPDLLSKSQAGKNTFVILSSGLISSLDTVLVQEMEKFNKLLNVMKSSLGELQKAIKGLVVMSLDLDKMYSAFLKGEVPPNWKFYSFASRKPLPSWFLDLKERVVFLRKWLKSGKPYVFPLNAFFFPQGFMTGILQTHARKYGVAVDELSFNFAPLQVMSDEVSDQPEDGVYINGIYLEGASFNVTRSLIEDAKPGEMYCSLPPIHMWPEINHKADPAKYQCPVYKTSERQGVLSTTGMSTNFVVALELETEKKPEDWILTGCAALLNLDT